uniref:serine/threonine-protein kinase Nek1-like isoform X2 n=1 Tax=Myxine glutinosa TaxID=7769 RepID=UPI00358FF0AE
MEAEDQSDKAGKEIEGDRIENHECTEIGRVNGNLETELVKGNLKSLKTYTRTDEQIQGNIDDLEELKQDEEKNGPENEKLLKPFACWARKLDNVEQKQCNDSEKGDVAGTGDGSIVRHMTKYSTNVSCDERNVWDECIGKAEYEQIDLEGLHSSQDKLLYEKDSDFETDIINSKHANDLAPMKKIPVGEFENREMHRRSTLGMKQNRMENNIYVHRVHLKTIFEEEHGGQEDEEEDNFSVGEEEDEKGSIFSRLESLRDQLECEMGFHLLHRVYLAIKASHEDEDAPMLEGSTATKRLIPPHFLHLYPRILHLVMADGAYEEGCLHCD